MDINLPGVSPSIKKDGTAYYRSSITHKRKHISLGSFLTAQNAYAAYQEATLLLSDQSIVISDFSDSHILSFGKWVSLLNFRDNKIYFSTPIYMKNKYFDYMISPDYILKFDIDDLFYFSSHKIMQRGRHFFVADYGMQINIANRYGIKNYAVPERDYRFVNGDDMDFRYENIEILNCYHGVSKRNTKKGIRFISKIHINGNYIIGSYHTVEEAAIAFNKAIDILQKNGIHKNYTPNYMETLSPSAYAEIYSKLHISFKIIKYRA